MNELVRNILMGSAGAGGDSTFVDDVFSTYLYRGNSSGRAIDNGIKLTDSNAGNSVYFDGSGDYLTQTIGSPYELRNWWDQAFTAEYWIRANVFGKSANTGSNVIGVTTLSNTGETWSFGPIDTGEVIFYYWNGSIQRVYSGKTLNANQWYHLAFVYDGSTGIKIFVDGTLEHSATVSGSPAGGSTTFSIGRITNNSGGGSDFNGNISNLRITHQALYTSNFTTPTSALTTTSQGATASNVKLLCCQSSTSATTATKSPATFTATGNVDAQEFGQFTGDGGEGGMVWIKRRDGADSHALFDTTRGVTKGITSNTTAAESTDTSSLTSFNNGGFSLGTGYNIFATNLNNTTYASWTFRKAPGFFDVVTFTSTGAANQRVPHNLECEPGLIICKAVSDTSYWVTYHRDLQNIYPSTPWDKSLVLDGAAGAGTYASDTWGTGPTSTDFGFKAGGFAATGTDWVAYVFAGGASSAAGARSVDFDGSGDYLSLPSTTDLNLTGDFTIEFWVYPRNQASGTRQSIIQTATSWGAQYAVVQVSHPSHVGKAMLWDYDMNSSNPIIVSNKKISEAQWTHIAFTRSSGTMKIWINGILDKTETGLSDSIEFGHTTSYIANHGNSYYLNAQLSNFRVVKGTALYSSSFKPSNKPLTNVTNTKLLCCNNSSVTGGTVIPSSTSTHSINVTASGSSAYTLSGNDINGSVSGNNVNVTVNVGDTLNFVVNASGHPFYIRVSSQGYNVSTPAATNQGSQSGTVSWTPNTAGSFVYQCGNHPGMIGTITVNASSGSITSNGDPTASSNSPFEDLEAFKFGEEGDQNIIKTGSYNGNGNADGPEVYLGWEPQWVMIKSVATSNSWFILDSMRGIVSGGSDAELYPNGNNGEVTQSDRISLTPTGFKINTTSSNFNTSGDAYIFMCLRRPDGLVGKPPEAGTDVFAMDTGNSSSTIPSFDSGFPVDMALYKYQITGAADWISASRLLGTNYVKTDSTAAQTSFQYFTWDSNVGWANEGNAHPTYYSWMWKRHAGFDVVAYTGNDSTKVVNHSLGRVPEMIWIKARNDTQNWLAYHKGLNGGTTPWNYHMVLNSTAAEGAFSFINQPTTTDFTVTSGWQAANKNYVAYLFASVEGISKVGRFAGNNTSMVVTTGFQPRFIVIKAASGTSGYGWFVWDSLRGMGVGNDPRLDLNTGTAQDSGYDYLNITSTGFSTVYSGWQNQAGVDFIYYAHA